MGGGWQKKGWRNLSACKMPPSTNFQGLPRAGCSGLDHPIQRDPAQRAPEDSNRLNAMRPRSGLPSRPAPGPSGTATASPCTLGVALDLSRISTKDLDRFIQDHLKPNPEFQKKVSKAIDAILHCLREKCVHKASRVSKVSRWVGTPMVPSWGTTVRRGKQPHCAAEGGQGRWASTEG